MVVPLKETEAEHLAPPHERSALAMKEWLLERLSVESNGKFSVFQLDQLLAQAKIQGHNLCFLPEGEFIRIFMHEDDFYINRERIKALHKEYSLDLLSSSRFQVLC